MSPLNTLARLLCATGLLAMSLVAPSFAAEPAAPAPAAQKTFATPEAAVDAVVAALRNDDSAALSEIFGPDSEELVSSGDKVADTNGRARWIAAYDTAHDLVKADDGSYTLEIGEDGWPTPIPIVQTDGTWRFDTDAGIDEVVYRRIGRNELGAIETCLGIAAAQKEYASQEHDGQPAGTYAHKLLSDPGKHNGLYWQPAEGERASPIGPFIAVAAAEGYKKTDSGSAPYHGYVYRLLTAQGAAAPGGAKKYVDAKGELTGGFGVVAYPVDYQASGVATFIMNQDGVVYQKDLGKKTTELAKAIKDFNPDKTWTKVADVEPDLDEADSVED